MNIQNYQQFADQFVPMTGVLSVEIFPDGDYGNIRIMNGNAPYIGSLEQPYYVDEKDRLEPRKFVSDTPYTDYLPKDLNFETFVYRCVSEQQPLHTYIKSEKYDFWMELFAFPLHSDRDEVRLCSFMVNVTKKSDFTRMADLPYQTASDVLSICVKLRNAKDFQKTMDEVIKDIRAICVAAQCVIMLMDFNHRACSVLCEDLIDDERIRSMRDIMGADFFEVAQSWADAVGGSSCFIVKDKHDWNAVRERSQEWYDHMKLNHVDSIVLFPLRYGKELLGYIWAINFDVQNVIRIKETLELTTFFLASEIANHQMVKRLEALSSIDLLTGILNRNAMSNRILQLDPTMERPSRSCGIVFADLNGLSRLNDDEGHYAGDMLLKNAALVLQKIFVGNEIYRAGGDEFMIVAIDITEAELERRVERLRRESAEGGVSFAVGSAFDSDGRDIRRTIRLADERMYEDKALYYRQHPDRMR